MAYTITNSRGNTAVTLADGAKNTNSTSLTLIGKNVPNYGANLNTNFYHLLENFAATSDPSNPIPGQLFYNTSTKTLTVRSIDNEWKNIGTAVASSVAPTNPNSGDSWFDTSGATGLLKVYDGSEWVIIGPRDSSAFGIGTGTIKDNITPTPGDRTVTRVIVSNSNAAVFSSQSFVTVSTELDGKFGEIVDGLTVYGNIKANSFQGDFFTGTANNSSFVGSKTAAQVESAVDAVVGIQANGVVSSFNNIYVDESILRGANALANIGNVGTVSKPFGNIFSRYFVGEASSALYADLAERFSADAIYDAGTVVRIGGTREITQENEELSTEVLGIVSENPAYLMNSDAGDNNTHPPVVIGGRVPVKIKGKVTKGQRLVSAGNGVARGAFSNEITAFNVIGRSLENKDTDEILSVNAIVKINT